MSKNEKSKKPAVKADISKDRNASALKKRLKYGTMATVLTAAFVVIVILLNGVVSLLTEQFGLYIDLTPEQAYALSDESKAVIETVNQPITIKVLQSESNFLDLDANTTVNGYATQVNETLKEYERLSDQITIEYIDVYKDPSALAEYVDIGATNDDFIVESETRSIKLTYDQMFNMSQNASTGLSEVVSSSAESAVTTSILGLLDDNPTKVTFFGGHEEKSISGLRDLLIANGYVLDDITLAFNDLDEETDVIVITAPSVDYTAEELQVLDDYMYNKAEYGKTILYFADATAPSLPILEGFLAEWGIVVGVGTVVDTDSSHTISTNSLFSRVFYPDPEADSPLYSLYANNDSFPVMNTARPLYVKSASKIDTETLISFGTQSADMPPGSPNNWYPDEEDLEAIPAVILSNQTALYNDAIVKSYVVAFGSYSFVDLTYLTNPSFENAEVMVELLSTVTNRDEAVSIYAKSITGNTYLDITTQQATLIMILFAFVLPAIILIFGLYVYIRRRHL